MNGLRNILLIAKLYALILILFFVFRLLLFITELGSTDLSDVGTSDILYAFVMGLRFDVVITGYIICLPTLVLFVCDFIKARSRFLNNFLFYWLLIFFSAAFFVCGADIPYFHQFFSRLTVTGFDWIDNPAFVAKMILQEPKYWWTIIPFALVVFLFSKALRFLLKKDIQQTEGKVYIKAVVYLLCAGLIFIGIRGRVQEKSPIRVGTAYFSTNPFLNQLGLNPVYTLLISYGESRSEANQPINLIDEQVAIANVQRYLGIKNPLSGSPIARAVVPNTVATNQPNVVFIIMESMSVAKMKRGGNDKNLTPFLDSLTHEGLYFENIYTAGMHTFNGIFSTLYSFPAIYNRHAMKQMNRYAGVPSTLRDQGYSTTYFTTHDGQFDNAEGFLHANDFENVITQTDYPLEEVKTTLGVPDDFMFRYAIPVLDSLHARKKPFFATLMTTSDHGPYYVPDYFKPKTNDEQTQIVEYADWSLRQFISMASKKEWFDNTIFMFIADHGAPLNVTYDIPLNYFHAPLLFYAPSLFDSTATYSQIGGQIDVYPTLMGLLEKPYINNTLGIDLLRESRPYIFINGDDKIGVLDTQHLLILKKGEHQLQFFNHKELDKNNHLEDFEDKAKLMEVYGQSNLQTFQYMITHDLLYVKPAVPSSSVHSKTTN